MVSLKEVTSSVIVVTTESHPDVLLSILTDVSAATQDDAKIVTESTGNAVVIVVIILSQPVDDTKLSITVKPVSQLVRYMVSLKDDTSSVMVVTTESQPDVLLSILTDVSAATQDEVKIVTESTGNAVVMVVIILSHPDDDTKLSITIKPVSQLVR